MADTYNRTLKMLSEALTMEEKGKAFYQKALQSIQNKLGREIFGMLASDEDIHMMRINKIYVSLKSDNVFPDEWKSIKPDHKDLNILFEELAKGHGKEIKAETSDIQALDIGLDFELRSVKFYEEQLEKAEDPKEKEFIEQMILEEKSHHTALSDMKLYLADPSAWFFEHEHTGLDGG
ncbi:MAG: ferritin family protein [Deltaproteobacteria bacterium]|nr:ferritin family protein [Deltaproteobacteria bacterium]